MPARPLTNSEISRVVACLANPRDQCLFILGLKTGFRISELLALTLSDVVQHGRVRETLTVSRRHMKGKVRSRTVVLHADAQAALDVYTRAFPVPCPGSTRLFPFTRMHAHRILSRAVQECKLSGSVSTHSMRKSFAERVYHALGRDLIATQRAMGHASVASTAQYLSFDQAAIDAAIRGEGGQN